jgi:hypothetical protein
MGNYLLEFYAGLNHLNSFFASFQFEKTEQNEGGIQIALDKLC